MKILLTGFSGTSSESLVKKADCRFLILPNHKLIDSQLLIEELRQRKYDYIFCFGQKPNIKDKIYLETIARNRANYILTNFGYNRLKKAFEENHLCVQLSENAGTSFCNALYWNGLDYIYNRGLDTKMIFLHIPFCKNITDSECFFDRVLTTIRNL